MSTLKVDGIRSNSASSDAITLASDGTCTAKITNNLSNRNLVINGAMQVAQRGTSSTASGMQTMDHWGSGYAADNVITQSQHSLTSSDTGPWEKGFRYSYHLLNGDTAASGTSRNELQQPIEAQFISQSGWDYTSASSYLTLSYWIKTSVANNFNHYVMTIDGTMKRWTWETGTISANTWTKITKKIPGNTNIQIDTDNGEGFRIVLAAFHGTSYTSSSVNNETWENWSSGARTKDNSTTWWTTDGATVEITGVQLEVSDHATSFEFLSFADELRRCQRYFFNIKGNTGSRSGLAAYANSSSSLRAMVQFPVPMRAIPTFSGTATAMIMDSSDDSDSFNISGFANGGSPTTSNPSRMCLDISTGGMTAGQGGQLEFRANNGEMNFSSEL